MITEKEAMAYLNGQFTPTPESAIRPGNHYAEADSAKYPTSPFKVGDRVCWKHNDRPMAGCIGRIFPDTGNAWVRADKDGLEYGVSITSLCGDFPLPTQPTQEFLDKMNSFALPDRETALSFFRWLLPHMEGLEAVLKKENVSTSEITSRLDEEWEKQMQKLSRVCSRSRCAWGRWLIGCRRKCPACSCRHWSSLPMDGTTKPPPPSWGGDSTKPDEQRHPPT